MGLFGGGEQKKDYGGRINEYKTKIEQLRSHGMNAAADRLQKELDKIDRDVYEKPKAMSVAQLKTQLKSSGAK